ncbi:MAG TPA: helix-turn-helix domain-containing protein, partial [Holophagaceae bacterium]|nr:helix-turn-helix domain-containing protein [Holophagaceae bacterium]
LCASGPASLTRLSSRFEVSRQAITKHLEVLSEAGLVASSREGRERIWAIEPKRLDEAHAYLDRISKQWDDALGRLQAFVEHEP